MKDSMRGGKKDRLATIRLILAAVKQVEVDQRIELQDADLLVILDKMAKQRRDSIDQFKKANREDLIAIEEAELKIISEFLPAALSEHEVNDLVKKAIAQTSATSMQDMGAVMAILKPQLQGRADMAAVSKLIKNTLTAS
jgi:uncharacterized protein YqeY